MSDEYIKEKILEACANALKIPDYKNTKLEQDCLKCQHYVGHDGLNIKECVKGLKPETCKAFLECAEVGKSEKPEPEQDESYRREYFLKNGMPCNEEGMFYPKYVEHIEAMCTSRNAEIAALEAEIESMRLGYQAIKGLLSFWSEMDKKDWEQMLEDVDDIVIGQLDKDS